MFVRNTSGACMGFQRSSSMFLHWNPGHFIALFLFISVVFTSPFFVHVLLPLVAPLGEACPLSPAVLIVLERGRGRRRSASPSLSQPGVSKITHILYLTLRWPLLTQPTPTYPHASSSGPSQSTSYLPSLVGVKIVIGPGWSLMVDERMDEVGGCSFSIIYMYNRDAFFIKLLNGIRDSFFTISSICLV